MLVLPEEMETEVLQRLPAKSVLRFSTVCRRWAALLSSEEFRAAWADLAESRTMEPAAQLLFLPLRPPAGTTSKVSTEVRCGDGRLLLTLDHVGDLCTGLAPHPCRGLNLLHDLPSGCFHVINAATGAVAKLPPHRQVLTSSGLGFDDTTKEYKVVRLFYTGDRPDLWSAKTSCEVYTLGKESDRRWRPPTSSADTHGVGVAPSILWAALFTSMISRPPVFVDGFLHWLVDPTFDDKPIAGASRPAVAVLSFSVAEEIFSIRVRPPPFDWYVHEVHLAVLDGGLCMVRDLRDQPSSSMEIWRYGDGSEAVWSIQHRIILAHHAQGDLLTEPMYVRVVGASVGKTRLIFVATSKCNVVAYDPMRGTLETILQPHLESESKQSLARFSFFKESLSPVH